MRSKIEDYTFEDADIIMTQTSLLDTVILDTAQGTIDFDFPKIQITMALTDEMQKGNPKPITSKTESKHTIPSQSTRSIHL